MQVCRLLPGLRITDVARPSGQRIVYFGTFVGAEATELEKWQGNGEDVPGHDVEEWGDVVVKISGGIDPATITYLQREIRILKGIDSIHYPKMFFDNVYTRDPYSEEPLDERLFVTIEEFIPSRPLSQCMDEFRGQEAALCLLKDIVAALQILWDQRPPIVHRDIKPDNILIRECGSVVIIDLGITREEGTDGVTATEVMIGPCTPDYTSPEQARNDKRNITFKSDVFVLGILAHVLLTRTNPFRPNATTTPLDALRNIVELEPSPLAEIVDVSPEFSDLVEQMLRKEPYLRPRTPRLLLKSLNDVRETLNGD